MNTMVATTSFRHLGLLEQLAYGFNTHLLIMIDDPPARPTAFSGDSGRSILSNPYRGHDRVIPATANLKSGAMREHSIRPRARWRQV